MRKLALLKNWILACGTLTFIFFAVAQLQIVAANLAKERVTEDLREKVVRFDSARARAIIEWKANQPQTCLWVVNLSSLQINNTLLDQAYSIGESFETIIPILQKTIDDTDAAIKCSPMRYQAIDLRRRVEVVTGYEETRDQKLMEYVNIISGR